MIEPFAIAVLDERLASIRARVEAFDWSAVADAGGWGSGVGLADLRRLVDHWLTHYDWRAQERRLNLLPQFTAEVLGQKLHFVHARGDGSRAPLLLLHGWPGSFLEFEALIAPLVADGHDVVVPSLPGFAFSGRPTAPIGPRQTAELMHRLMAELFGGRRYLVQGGDWGAAIGAWMAYGHPDAVAALHLNMVLIQAEDALPRRPDELAWAARRAALAKEESGYSQEQGTRPQTLGVAMADSPVGVAAWILEKFGAWADVPRDADGRPDLWHAFDEDLILTNIMLYLVEASFVTSTWIYRGRVLEGSGQFPPGTRIAVPTGVAAFPDPVFPPPPRSQVERTYDVVHWTDMAKGGHFAALEQPEPLLADMRRFFRQDFGAARNTSLLYPILIGAVAGMRAMTPLATVANAARRGELPPGNGAPALLANPLVSAGALAIAAGEFAGDKMKSAPDRIVLAGMAARIVTGALAGAALVPRRRRSTALLLGAAAAVGAAYLTFNLRVRAMNRYGRTSTGLVEDALALVSAAVIARSAARAHPDAAPGLAA